MANQIKVKRGLKSNLPNLAQGEIALTTDFKEVWVGGASGNFLLNNRDIINSVEFGVKGDNLTNSAINLQNCVDYFDDAGGIILLPRGTIRLEATVNIDKPIIFIGGGSGGLSSNPNNGVGVTHIKYMGTAGTPMFVLKNETLNSYLFGVQFNDVLINGNELASYGVHGKSVANCVFKNLQGWLFRNEFIYIDDSNGVISQFNKYENIHWVSGVNPITENSNGITQDGVNSLGVTQSHFIDVWGYPQNGYAVTLGYSDNNVIEKLFGGLKLFNSGGVGAWNNYIKYLAGNVKAESLTYGNKIEHITSEGNNIIIDNGGILDYKLQDYLQCATHITPSFTVFESLPINLGDLINQQNLTTGELANQWGVVFLPTGLTAKAGCNINKPQNWWNGTIKEIKIKFSKNISSSGKNVNLFCKLTCYANNESIETPQKTEINVVGVADAPYVIEEHTFTMNIPYTLGDSLLINIGRQGADATDTLSGDLAFISGSVEYESNLADSVGSGSYDISNNYK